VRRSKNALPLFFGAVAFLTGVPLSMSATLSPLTVTAEQAADQASKFGSKHDFPLGVTGMQFFQGRLYVGSNIGVLEFERGSLLRAYQWNKRDSVVEGPWRDEINNRLWVWLPGGDLLSSYDGTKWGTTNLPQPTNQLVLRGDMGAGFRGVSNDTSFWLEGARHAWTWNSRLAEWKEEANPPTQGSPQVSWSHLTRLVPVSGHPFYVMRNTSGWNIHDADSADPKIPSDSVLTMKADGSWQAIPNMSGDRFFVEHTTAIGDYGYLLTNHGVLLEVSRTGIRKLEAPDFCEALARTSQGTLLAAFREGGIYEFKKDWQLVCQIPVAHDGAHWTHLAGDNGNVAYATDPVPRLVSKGDDYKTVYDAAATLWLFQDGKMQKITWPPAAEVKPASGKAR
jgi:hypothetical protein